MRLSPVEHDVFGVLEGSELASGETSGIGTRPGYVPAVDTELLVRLACAATAVASRSGYSWAEIVGTQTAAVGHGQHALAVLKMARDALVPVLRSLPL